MHYSPLGQSGLTAEQIVLTPGDAYDDIDHSQTIYGREEIYRWDQNPDLYTVETALQNLTPEARKKTIGKAMRELLFNAGIQCTTPLDLLPGSIRYTPGSGNVRLYSARQKFAFPGGLTRSPSEDEFSSIQKSYWIQAGEFSKLSSAQGGDIITFMRYLKKWPLYGISLWPNTGVQAASFRVEQSFIPSMPLPFPGVDSSGIAIDPTAPLRAAETTSAVYDISIPTINLYPHIFPNLPGQPYLGFSEKFLLQYISLIEDFFAKDMLSRAVNYFNSMHENAKNQCDETILKALYTDAVDMLSNINNLIAARIPVTVVDNGTPIYSEYSPMLGIPGMIPDPRNGYAPYYPRKRLSEIYTAAMMPVANRLADTLGMQTWKATTPDAPPPECADPTKNIMVQVDPEASQREGTLVYRDYSKNSNLLYTGGTTYRIGTQDDVSAYMNALRLPETYYHKPTGELALSDLYRQQLLPEDQSPIAKYGLLAALASGAAWFLASR